MNFVRSTLMLASGTIIAQLASLLVSPLLTRLYDADAFGKLGLFMSAIGVLIPLAALSLPAAIVLPQADKLALALSRAALAIAGVTAGVIVVVGTMASLFIDSREILGITFVFAGLVILLAVHQVLDRWAIRRRAFSVKSRAFALGGISLCVVQVFGGIFWPHFEVLVAAYCLGMLVQVTVLYRTRSDGPSVLAAWFTPRKRWALALRRYQNFAKYRAPDLVLDAVGQGVPVALIGWAFGIEMAGMYTLCRTVLNAPVRLLGTAVADVYYSGAARRVQARLPLAPVMLRTTIALAAVAVVPFVGFAVLSPQIFSVVFGAAWRQSGEMARVLVPWLVLMLLNRPAVQSLQVMGAQRVQLYLGFINISLRSMAIVVPHLLGMDVNWAIAGLSSAGVISNGVLIFVAWHLVSRFDMDAATGRR